MKNILLILSMILITEQVFAQSKKSKKTTKTTKTVTKTTTTSTKTINEENTETNSSLLPEDQKKIDLGIGKKLSGLVKIDSLRANSTNGITVRRYISNEEGKIGADIFETNPDSKFTKDSLSSIIASYISDNFEYSAQDSELISDLVMEYNIKNRKNFDYIIQNYSTNVILSTKKDKVGYQEKQNGQIQILLPSEKNILKKFAIDVHSMELLNGSKSELLTSSSGEEKLSRFNKFYQKKLDTESEEVNLKLGTATPAELKSFTEKSAQVKLKQDMLKEKVTSEKEFLESKKSKIVSTTTTTTQSTTISNGIVQAVNAPELPRNKFNNFIYGFNHPGINAREFILVPNLGIISIGYDSSKLEKKELQVFITSNGDYLLKKTSEGIKIPETSPLVYSGGKIYVFEVLKNETYLVQFNQDLEFESRTETSINPNSTVQVIGEEVILNSVDKAAGKNVIKIYKVKDLTVK